MARGFGLCLEEDYGDVLDLEDIEVDWFQKMTEVNFDLGDEAETDDGGSRSDDIAWAGAAKPNGSTSAKVDLQRMTWYLLGFLDQYVHTAGTGDLHIHEFWGGENHELTSFVGIAMYDALKIALYGLIEDGLKLEVSDSAMTVNADWLYATEQGEILDIGEDFVEPEELEDSRIPVRFFDVSVLLNGEKPGSVQTSFNMEGSNNHDQDGTIGLSSRFPQEKPQAAKRTIKLSLATTLNRRSYREILNARYGEVNAVRPHACKILKVPLELRIVQCENPNQKLIIQFPQCTLKAEFDLKGADRVEATLNLQTLGNNEVTLNDGTTKVNTDIYCKLINKVPELTLEETPAVGD
ncbi:carboxypeptidase regulatory-like domain-containing protein [Methanobrevibacter sp.]|uniref:carboxypeptidase regulatory-like domain-containing protein n=1 Tax=Methanobrevibacter sp. TaxID=66852 RepID=UPI0038642B7B